MQSYDTIVIGLGASGTAAASTLAQAGKRVLALEAQDRIGGRVKTVPFGNGVVEEGAEWIHGTVNSVVYDLAVKNNVSITTDGLNFEVYRSDGSAANRDIVNDLTTFALEIQEHPPEEPEPLGQFITRKLMEYIKEKHPKVLDDKEFLEEFLNFLDLVVDNYEASNNWNDVTTHTSFVDLAGNQQASWHRHGYKTLFEILLNTYNGGPGYPNLEMRLNTEVTNIQWPQDPEGKVTVTTKDGTTYTADNVIVTLSVGVLKESHSTLFTPKLPAHKTECIENISMGTVGKLILLFDRPVWTKNCMFLVFIWDRHDKMRVGRADYWTTKLFGVSCPAGTDNALTVWTSGDAGKAVESLPEEEVKRKAMSILRMFLGKAMDIPEPIGFIRSTWHTNPFTRGSYTYDDLDMPKHPTSRSDLAAPLLDSSGKPRVLFAGEATNADHFSTVHGAVESGYREARRLLPTTKL